MQKLVDKIDLPNGLQVLFSERSYRYFGDYNKIAISVRLRVPNSVLAPPEGMAVRSAQETEMVECEVTTLEQMAVPTDNIDAVRHSLIQGFLDTAGDYLKSEKFIEKLLCKKSVRGSS